MALNTKSLMSLVVTIAVGLIMFGVITSFISEYTEKDPVTGAPVKEGMTNSTVALLGLVPFLVIVGITLAAVYIVLPGRGD